jgi:hypothetical protein
MLHRKLEPFSFPEVDFLLVDSTCFLYLIIFRNATFEKISAHLNFHQQVHLLACLQLLFIFWCGRTHETLSQNDFLRFSIYFICLFLSLRLT